MMETFLRILNWPMDTPTLYGWYHILWLVIPFVAAWLLCRSYLNSQHPQTHIRKVIFYTAVLVAVFEVLHQINYNLVWADGRLQVDMQWYAFPFQFCSTPMYAGLLTGLFRRGRIHDALCSYLATYAVFAGQCVMLYPGDVFIDVIVINIQTMICHSSMLTIGIYLFFTGHVKTDNRTLLKALPVFIIGVFLAMVMNELAFQSGLLAAGHTFNMFFISPYCEPSLPVYSTVQRILPYPWCLMVYVLVFTLAAYVILLAARALLRRKAHHA